MKLEGDKQDSGDKQTSNNKSSSNMVDINSIIEGSVKFRDGKKVSKHINRHEKISHLIRLNFRTHTHVDVVMY
jgi:hypothetical protein